MKDKEQLEREMVRSLTDGDMEGNNPVETAPKRLAPPYEIRIRAEKDPIAEETKLVRQKAREVDNRYDRYARCDKVPEE